ncbi:MAG TPA: hypothetical protein VF511_09350, partial [Chthoniobacterales bacterium]
VTIGMIVLVPLALWSRKASHPAMTLRLIVIIGILSGIASFAFYTVRYFLSAPRSVSVSEAGVTLERRNGLRELSWAEITEAKFVNRWGDSWAFQSAGKKVVLGGEGFNQSDWDRLRVLIIERLIANRVPFRVYDRDGKCIHEFDGALADEGQPATSA